MNNQQLVELSEKIRDHLTKQKARAVQEVPVVTELGTTFETRCRYRGDNGTMCAVGCLIPDERYDISLEGFSAGHHSILGAVFGDDVTSDDEHKAERLFATWQHYHDHGDYRQWCEGAAWASSPESVHLRMLAVYPVGV